MQQIVNFLIKYKNTLFFLFLFLLSVIFTIQSHSYHKSKFISSANFFTGGIYSWVNDIDMYFHLKEYNERLVDENKRLRENLAALAEVELDSVFTDTTSYDEPYKFITAKVIANRYAKLDNFLLVNKGKLDSVATDYGVITSRGIVGIVDETSQNYSRVISILNTNSAINVKLKKSDHFGTLTWNGKDPNKVQIEEIPRLAPVKKGDTIHTDGRSLIFPKGIPVGVVEDFHLENNQNYYEIEVRLFNDMTNVGYVYLIKNNNQEEIKNLDSNE